MRCARACPMSKPVMRYMFTKLQHRRPRTPSVLPPRPSRCLSRARSPQRHLAFGRVCAGFARETKNQDKKSPHVPQSVTPFPLPPVSAHPTKYAAQTPPRRGCGMNTFSQNGNDFVGRLLHEGGVWCRTFFGFFQCQNSRYGRAIIAAFFAPLPLSLPTRTGKSRYQMGH